MLANVKRAALAKKLRFETLESRHLLSGTVHAFIAGGNLFVLGGSADNGVAITETAAGLVTLTGLSYGAPVGGANATKISAFGSNFTVVNDNVVTFNASAVTKSFYIDLGGGNDFLSMGALQLPATLPASTTPPVAPTVGLSTDVVTVPRSLDIDMGRGNKVILLNNVSVGGSASVEGGSGNNFIDVAGLTVAGTVGMYSGRLSIDTRGGADTIVASADVTHTTTALATYISTEVAAGDTALGTFFGGNNFITSSSESLSTLETELTTFTTTLLGALPAGATSFTASRASVDTGGGADNVTVENADVSGNFWVDLGRGDDVLNYGANVVGGKVFLDGDSGTDTINSIAGAITANTPPGSNPRVKSFETFGTFV